jgi:hypothetical protein
MNLYLKNDLINYLRYFIMNLFLSFFREFVMKIYELCTFLLLTSLLIIHIIRFFENLWDLYLKVELICLGFFILSHFRIIRNLYIMYNYFIHDKLWDFTSYSCSFSCTYWKFSYFGDKFLVFLITFIHSYDEMVYFNYYYH